jgi:hypothetical protein
MLWRWGVVEHDNVVFTHQDYVHRKGFYSFFLYSHTRRLFSYFTHSVLSPYVPIGSGLPPQLAILHPQEKENHTIFNGINFDLQQQQSASSDGTGIREWMCSLRSTTCVVTTSKQRRKGSTG